MLAFAAASSRSTRVLKNNTMFYCWLLYSDVCVASLGAENLQNSMLLHVMVLVLSFLFGFSRGCPVSQ